MLDAVRSAKIQDDLTVRQFLDRTGGEPQLWQGWAVMASSLAQRAGRIRTPARCNWRCRARRGCGIVRCGCTIAGEIAPAGRNAAEATGGVGQGHLFGDRRRDDARVRADILPAPASRCGCRSPRPTEKPPSRQRTRRGPASRGRLDRKCALPMARRWPTRRRSHRSARSSRTGSRRGRWSTCGSVRRVTCWSRSRHLRRRNCGRCSARPSAARIEIPVPADEAAWQRLHDDVVVRLKLPTGRGGLARPRSSAGHGVRSPRCRRGLERRATRRRWFRRRPRLQAPSCAPPSRMRWPTCGHASKPFPSATSPLPRRRRIRPRRRHRHRTRSAAGTDLQGRLRYQRHGESPRQPRPPLCLAGTESPVML